MRYSIFVFLLCISCLSSDSDSTLSVSEGLSERFVTNEFSIAYPENWSLDSTVKKAVQFYLKTPQESQEDVFLENINLLKHEFTIDSLNFDGYVARQIDIILDKTNDGNLIESEFISASEPRYQRIVYTGTTKTQEYKFLQHLMMKNDIGYLLTFTAEVEEFSNYHDQADKVMSSFRFK